MQSLLDGLPLETQTYSSYEPSGLQSLAGTLGVGNDINKLLQEMFNIKPASSPTGQTDEQKAAVQALIDALAKNPMGAASGY